jgi:hypothetical protein
MTQGAPYTGDVARLHAEWAEVHGQLRKMEQVLSDCIELYVKGQAGRPDQVIAEVERLRTVCGGRFQALMTGVKGTP